MFEFIFGYALGSSARNSTPMSGKTVAIIVLVLMAVAGMGYMMLPFLFPASASVSAEQCGGGPVASGMCELGAMAPTIGILLVGCVVVIAVVWGLFASMGSGEQ